MRFYNDYYDSCFDELITYYPQFYIGVFEMEEVLKAQGMVLDGIRSTIEQTYFNCFIDYADETTIANLERFLGIGLNKSRTPEERRRLVKSFFVGSGKVSASILEEMIQSYTGAKVKSRFEPFDSDKNNMLYIEIDRGNESTLYMSDIILLLNHKIPAHIKWQAAITYPFPIGVGIRRSHYRVNYDLCGTKPDIATLGAISHVETVIKTNRTKGQTDYKTPQETQPTGTYPNIATIGSVVSVKSVSRPTAENVIADYKASQESSQEAGKEPYNSLIGDINEINAVSSVKRTEYSVNYKYCGTQYTQS